jgi:hypothetical protein
MCRIHHHPQVWAKVFPVQWNVRGAVCERFCVMTKEHFTVLLRQAIPDVTTLVDALRKTITYEDYNNIVNNPAKAGDKKALPAAARDDEEEKPTDDAADGNADAAAQDAAPVEEELSEAEKIKRKYAAQFKARGGESEQARAEREAVQAKLNAEKIAKEKADKAKADAAAAALALAKQAKTYQFRGMISACFTPYMGQYVQLEIMQSKQTLEQTLKAEPFVPESLSDPRECYNASSQMFTYIQRSIVECTEHLLFLSKNTDNRSVYTFLLK